MHIRLFAGALLLTFAAPAMAEDWDFVLVNKTGKSIKLVEVSETAKADWSKERMDEDRAVKPIGRGESHTVHFTKGDKACAFDVRLTFEDDSQGVWGNFNVCNYAFGDFSFKGETPVVKGT